MKDLMQYAINAGKEEGFEEVEAFYNQNTQLELGVFESALDRFSKSSIKGIGIRGIKSGKTGFAYTENIDKDSVKETVEAAFENMLNISSKDETEFSRPGGTYTTVLLDNSSFGSVSIKEKIKKLFDAEKYALSLSDRIHKISHLIYGETESYDMLTNSYSLHLSQKRNYGYFYINAVIKDGDKFRSAFAFQVVKDFGEIDMNRIADEAINEALSKTGAVSMPSGEYTVVFKNRMFAKLLDAFFPVFSAERVQKGLSKLKDQLGAKIGSDILTITDDPFHDMGMMNSAFDGEGTAAKKKDVIKDGVLMTYLYNIKTAKKDGAVSTGNAGRNSYKSGISTAPYNFYIDPGDVSYDEAIKKIDDGILITDLAGLHSGINPVSCDFSLPAQGFKITNGAVAEPVSDITVSGNFLEILKNLKCIYDDLLFDIPSSGHFGSPSVEIDGISIAGDGGAK